MNKTITKLIINIVLLIFCACFLASCGESIEATKSAQIEISEIVNANDASLLIDDKYQETPLSEAELKAQFEEADQREGYTISYLKKEKVKHYSEEFYNDNKGGLTYIGNVVLGEMTNKGLNISAIEDRQPPATYYLDTCVTGKASVATVNAPYNGSEVVKAVAKMISEGVKDQNLPENTELNYYAFSSKAEIIDYFKGVELFPDTQEDGEVYVAVVLKKVFYSISVDRKMINEYFSEKMTVDKMNKIIASGKVPLYISKVEYGSMSTTIYSSANLTEKELIKKINVGSDSDAYIRTLKDPAFSKRLYENDICVRYFSLKGGSSNDNKALIIKDVPSVADLITTEKSDYVGYPISYQFNYVSTGEMVNIADIVDVVVPKYNLIIPKGLTYNQGVTTVKRGVKIQLQPNDFKLEPYTPLFNPTFKLETQMKGVTIEETSGIISIAKDAELFQTFTIKVELRSKTGEVEKNITLPVLFVQIRIEEELKETRVVSINELAALSASGDLKYVEHLIIDVSKMIEADKAKIWSVKIPSTIKKMSLVGNLRTNSEVIAKNDSASTYFSSNAVPFIFDFDKRDETLAIDLENISIKNQGQKALFDFSQTNNIALNVKGMACLLPNDQGNKAVLNVDHLTVNFANSKNKNCENGENISLLQLGLEFNSGTLIEKTNSNSTLVIEKKDYGRFRVLGNNAFNPNPTKITLSHNSKTPLARGSVVTITTNVAPSDVNLNTLIYEITSGKDYAEIVIVDGKITVKINEPSKDFQGRKTIVVTAKSSNYNANVTGEVEIETENAYDIEALTDIKMFDSRLEDSSAIFNLTNDIDASDFSSYYGNLRGIFDGNGHTIKNYSHVTDGIVSFGLFAKNSGTIRNIKIENFNLGIKGTRQDEYKCGVIAGDNSGTIENIIVKNSSVKFGDSSQDGGDDQFLMIGGIAGLNTGKINKCVFSNGTISSNIYKKLGEKASLWSELGGIVGRSNGGAISNCSAFSNEIIGIGNINNSPGNVNGSLGGIVGHAQGTTQIENCYSKQNLLEFTSKGGYPGIVLSFKLAYLRARVGGVVGLLDSPNALLKTSFAEGNSQSTTTNHYKSASVRRREGCGAVVGIIEENSKVKNCCAVTPRNSKPTGDKETDAIYGTGTGDIDAIRIVSKEDMNGIIKNNEDIIKP